MKLFKLTVILSALMLISTMAWAGNVPEYDAVGCDMTNYFAQNCVYYNLVDWNPAGTINGQSDFTDPANFTINCTLPMPFLINGVSPVNVAWPWGEQFCTNSGQLQPNPCYGIDSGLTDAWNEGLYQYWIVLQKKPESDLNINIYDCVLKHNEFDIFTGAEQTGRYRQPWGELVFESTGNPLVSASAIPGPYATSGFSQWYAENGFQEMILDARTMPGLVKIALDGVPYTSKANFPEGLVVVMPDTGLINESGQPEWNLKDGDIIHVTIKIPDNANTADVWYGPESVIVKYIGVVGTGFVSGVPCCQNQG